jgi:3-oxoacyl-[acyl-carrier protein] reductase
VLALIRIVGDMDLGIEGRVAVVTGGGSGIGEAVVERLRAAGATVHDASRATGVDVTRPDAAERVAELAGPRVDILVNNAGTSYARALDELTDEDWQRQWDLNVMGPMRLMRALAPGMAERGWGRIVNVSSSAGKRPSLTNASYSVGKAAQLSLSRVFADTYAPRNVLVNAVAPGAVASPLWMADGGLGDQTAKAKGLGSREEALDAQRDRIPLARFAEPGEIADVIVFLCSERASMVAGAAWSVDGGTVPVIL